MFRLGTGVSSCTPVVGEGVMAPVKRKKKKKEERD